MTHRPFWETVVQRFDPIAPVNEDAWRAERPHSPRESILAALRRPFGGTKRFVVMGTVGTGKTTELLAIADAQRQDNLVVFLDVWRHFEERIGDPAALDHVQPWEVLLLIGIAVYGSAEHHFGHAWSRQHLSALEDAIAAFTDDDDDRPRVDLARLASTMAILAGGPVGGVAGAGLAAIGAAAGAARWELTLGRSRDRYSDQDDRVRNLLAAVNAMIGTLQHAYQRLVILVDGLDRIKEPDTTRALFTDSSLLGSLVCATIFTGPLILRRSRLAAQLRHFEPKVLANVPVLDHARPGDPDVYGPGMAFMLEVYRRRVAGLPAADQARIPERHLHKLAYYSGGRVRDFIRFVRMTAELSWDTDADATTDDAIDHCIDERRRVMELGLNRADIELLADVARDPEHILPDGDNVEGLLDQWCLLPYPNESEWYFPHPLLMLRRIRPDQTPG